MRGGAIAALIAAALLAPATPSFASTGAELSITFISVFPKSPMEGDSLSVTIGLANNGTLEANFTITWSIDESALSSDSAVVPAGGQAQYNLSAGSFASGLHSLAVWLDAANVWSEADEADNYQNTTFKVAAPGFRVNSTSDAVDDIIGDGICATAQNVCTLRAAIQEANSNPNATSIHFEIGAGARTINIESTLPALTGATNLDGTTQPGYNGTPLIRLSGTIFSVAGLRLDGPSSVVRGLSITGFTAGPAILVRGAGGHVIAGNYLGLLTDGVNPGPNRDGVRIESSGNLVGGLGLGDGNVISGNNAHGIAIANTVSISDNQVLGNLIGTDASGLLGVGNLGAGIVMADNATDTIIGGSIPGARNVVSANNQSGIRTDTVTATGNRIVGNFIGTDAGGLIGLGNTDSGIQLVSSFNQVGEANSTLGRNVIANSTGVGIWVSGAGVTGNSIVNNYIGTPATGSGDLGNLDWGIIVDDGAFNNTIGGNAGSGNLISGNNAGGVVIAGETSDGNVIGGNLIGTNGDGTAAVGNGDNDDFGILTLDADDTNIIGNVISGNKGHGVLLSGSDRAVIQGNFVGTNSTGLGAIGNLHDGMELVGGTTNTLVGGLDASFANVISGNGDCGLGLYGNASVQVTSNTIQGNFIGVAADGRSPLGNGCAGLDIYLASNNLIGGTESGAGNVIGNNSVAGINFGDAGAFGNAVYGNFIGTNADGVSGLGNAVGVVLQAGAHDNLVGLPGLGNVISGNTAGGIRISGDASDANSILGNRIGTDSAGATAVSNGWVGIQVDDADGTNITGNLVSGNGAPTQYGIGISLAGTSGTIVQGNLIGTDVTGLQPLGNWGEGLELRGGTTTTLVGGTSSAFRNVISANGIPPANGGCGIGLYGSAAAPVASNIIQGNYIGVGSDGSTPLGNDCAGIDMDNATNNVIGGIGAGEQNVISGNGGDGIQISSASAGNTVRGNHIFGNGELGIDLAPDGVTPNDATDADSGPNGLQNFPMLVSPADGASQVNGTLVSAPSTSYTIDLFSSSSCDASGFGEGADYLGSTSTNTDSAGVASFTLPVVVSVASLLTATATGPNGTSEFSQCAPVSGCADNVCVLATTGPLDIIYSGLLLRCQVVMDGVGQYFVGNTGPASCGTSLGTGSSVYYGYAGTTPFSQVSAPALAGSGSGSDPYRITSVQDAGSTGLRVTQTESYVVGELSLRVDISVANSGQTPQTIGVWRAVDCYLGGSDSGYGYLDTANLTVACAKTANGETGSVELFRALTPGAHLMQAGYYEVYNRVASGLQFPDTCICNTSTDNGAGISWQATVDAGMSATFSLLQAFSGNGTTPIFTEINDDDGDGVINPADACPSTAPGERVEANGCPPPVRSLHVSSTSTTTSSSTRTVSAGENFDLAFQIRSDDVLDANATDLVVLNVAAAPAGGSLGGPGAARASNGLANFTNLTLDVQGNYTLEASGSLLVPISQAFLVAPGPAVAPRFLSTPSDVPVNGIFPVVVELVDAGGNQRPRAGSVTLSVLDGTATLAGNMSNSEGPTFGGGWLFNVSLAPAGTHRLVATWSFVGPPTSDTSDPLNVQPAGATGLLFEGLSNNTTTDDLVDFKVHIVDGSGTRVDDATHVVTLTASGGSEGTQVHESQAFDGVASFGLMFFTPGNYTLEARAEGVNSTTRLLTVDAGVPAFLSFAVQPPESMIQGDSFNVTVDVRDGFGNLVPNSPVAVSLSLSADSDPGSLTGNVTGTTSNGLLVLRGISVSGPGFFRLFADSPSTSGTSSQFFLVNPQGANQAVDLALTPTSATVAAGGMRQFSVVALNDTGQPIDGLFVQLEVFENGTPSSIGYFDGDGVFYGFVAGTATVNATLYRGNLPPLYNESAITVTPGLLAQFQIVPGLAVMGNIDAQLFTAEGQDAFGNAINLGAQNISWTLDGANQLNLTSAAPYAVVNPPNGVHVVDAWIGDARNQAFVFVTSQEAEAGNTTEIDASSKTNDINGTQTTEYAIGLREAEAGAEVRIDAATTGGNQSDLLREALVELAAGAQDVAISIETRLANGAIPEELDAANLTEVLEGLGGASEAAIFLHIGASVSGTDLNSTALNALLGNVTLSFQIPITYFDGPPRLDPARVRLIEYSNGSVIHTNIFATFVRTNGANNIYNATVDQFSTFAIVGASLSAAVSGATGGTGGGGGGGGGGSGVATTTGLPAPISLPTGDPSIPRIDIQLQPGVERSQVVRGQVFKTLTGPPADAPAIPPGVTATHFMQVELAGDGKGVASISFQVSLAPTEVVDADRAVLLHLRDGAWHPEAHILLTLTEGRYVGTVSSTCCSAFAVAFDLQAPTLSGRLPFGTVSGLVTITSGAADNLGIASVQLRNAEGIELATSRAAPFAVAVQASDLPEGLLEARLVAVDFAGNEASLTGTFTVRHALVEPGDTTATVQTPTGSKSTWLLLGVVGLAALAIPLAVLVGRRNRKAPTGSHPSNEEANQIQTFGAAEASPASVVYFPGEAGYRATLIPGEAALNATEAKLRRKAVARKPVRKISGTTAKAAKKSAPKKSAPKPKAAPTRSVSKSATKSTPKSAKPKAKAAPSKSKGPAAKRMTPKSKAQGSRK